MKPNAAPLLPSLKGSSVSRSCKENRRHNLWFRIHFSFGETNRETFSGQVMRLIQNGGQNGTD